jgi:sigma-E factor negative regulatory protein RseA
MKNQLSALIDGELDIESSQHLITSAKSGGELKTTWAAYHLIGDAMRGDAPLRQDFTSRVMMAIESEPIVLVPKALTKNESDVDNITPITTKKSALKTSGFWSIAASVAAVMFVGVMVLQQQVSYSPEQIVMVKTEKVEPNDALAPIEIAQSIPTEYLQAHQAAAPTGAAYYIQDASFVGSNK